MCVSASACVNACECVCVNVCVCVWERERVREVSSAENLEAEKSNLSPAYEFIETE